MLAYNVLFTGTGRYPEQRTGWDHHAHLSAILRLDFSGLRSLMP